MTLAELNTAGSAAFVSALGSLFEHSPWVAERAAGRRPFRNAEHLHAELCAAVRAASRERQLALIRAHPDLAGRLAREGRLTAESAREQAGAGLDRLGDGELAVFQALNGAYRERFGFPFVICARLNAREAILASLRKRIENNPEAEFEAALAEIDKIAWLRLQDKLKD